MTAAAPETPQSSASSASERPAQQVSFRDALEVWLKIGLLGFGGPAGQIALMHRVLVEERGWIDERRFLHALNFCMLLPGPEAMQLATYVGWTLHRTAGAIAAGILFVLPGAFIVLALSVLYATLQHLPAVEALFYGVKPAVAAIVVEALLRIGRRSLRSTAPTVLAVAAFVAIFGLDLPFPVIVLGAVLIGFLRPGWFAATAAPETGTAAPAPSLMRSVATALPWLALWLLPVASLVYALGADHVLASIAVFFSKMAVVTFGGAYAVLAYVAQEAVGQFGWLQPREMVDGLGLAETTPGPLILVLEFVGFMAAYRSPGTLDPVLAGAIGGAITLWVTFTPCFLMILVGAPYIDAIARVRALAGALAAVTAAVTGVIANLSVWFALHVWFGDVVDREAHGLRLIYPRIETLDPVALLLSVAAMIALIGFRVGLLPTLAGTALAGALWHAIGRTIL